MLSASVYLSRSLSATRAYLAPSRWPPQCHRARGSSVSVSVLCSIWLTRRTQSSLACVCLVGARVQTAREK